MNRIARLLAFLLCLCLAAQPSLARVGGDCAHGGSPMASDADSPGHEGHAGHDMSGDHAAASGQPDCAADCSCAMSACHYTGSVAGLVGASARVPSLLAGQAPRGRLSTHAASAFDQSPLRPPIAA